MNHPGFTEMLLYVDRPPWPSHLAPGRDL